MSYLKTLTQIYKDFLLFFFFLEFHIRFLHLELLSIFNCILCEAMLGFNFILLDMDIHFFQVHLFKNVISLQLKILPANGKISFWSLSSVPVDFVSVLHKHHIVFL